MVFVNYPFWIVVLGKTKIRYFLQIYPHTVCILELFYWSCNYHFSCLATRCLVLVHSILMLQIPPVKQQLEWLTDLRCFLIHEAVSHILRTGHKRPKPLSCPPTGHHKLAASSGWVEISQYHSVTRLRLAQTRSRSLYLLRRTDTWSLKSTGSRRNWECIRGM